MTSPPSTWSQPSSSPGSFSSVSNTHSKTPFSLWLCLTDTFPVLGPIIALVPRLLDTIAALFDKPLESSGYGAPASSYGAPEPSYGAPAPAYGAPSYSARSVGRSQLLLNCLNLSPPVLRWGQGACQPGVRVPRKGWGWPGAGVQHRLPHYCSENCPETAPVGRNNAQHNDRHWHWHKVPFTWYRNYSHSIRSQELTRRHESSHKPTCYRPNQTLVEDDNNYWLMEDKLTRHHSRKDGKSHANTTAWKQTKKNKLRQQDPDSKMTWTWETQTRHRHTV